MKAISLYLIPLLVVCAGFLAYAQDTPNNEVEETNQKILLNWSLDKDSELKYEIKSESSSDIENQGSTITEMKSVISNVSLKCNEIKDKNMMIEMRYDRIRFSQFSSQFPEQIRFDSNKKEDNARTKYDISLLPFAAIVKKDKSFTFNLTGAGKVSEVKGYNKLIDDIYTDLKDPIYENTKEQVQKTFSNSVMETSLNSLFGILPETPLSKGMSWNKSYTTEILYVGEVQVTSTFTLDKVYKENGKIYADIKLESKAKTTKPIEDEVEIIKDFKVKGNLTGSELSGTFIFNVTDGNIKIYDATQKLNYTLTIISEGRKIEAAKTVTNKTLMKLMTDEEEKPKNEENPDEKKPEESKPDKEN